MRISDWSSDVCSSDLQGDGAAGRRLQADVVQRRLGAAVGERYRLKAHGAAGNAERTGARRIDDLRLLVEQREDALRGSQAVLQHGVQLAEALQRQIGRASCRERVGQYV